MGMQKVEFEFPEGEETGTEIEVEESSATSPFEEPEAPKEGAKKPDKDELDIEVVDDTPKADQGRTPSDPPEPVTDDELGEYSEKVRKRIKHFSKGYHDERRAKETAQRERDELERLARQIISENEQLKHKAGNSQNVMLAHAKKTVARDLELAKQKYKTAYDAGNSDAVLEAQTELNQAQFRTEQLNAIKPPALQQPQDGVQQGQQVPQAAQPQRPPAPAPQRQAPDPRATEWAAKNTWFGQDQEMTALALGAHATLVESGIDPTSDEYYERLNARMHQVFPEKFGDATSPPPAEPNRPSNVVAPVTRSTTPKKVKLTQTQVSLARKLGIPIEEYAKQVAIEMRKGNG